MTRRTVFSSGAGNGRGGRHGGSGAGLAYDARRRTFVHSAAARMQELGQVSRIGRSAPGSPFGNDGNVIEWWVRYLRDLFLVLLITVVLCVVVRKILEWYLRHRRRARGGPGDSTTTATSASSTRRCNKTNRFDHNGEANKDGKAAPNADMGGEQSNESPSEKPMSDSVRQRQRPTHRVAEVD